MLGFFRKQPSVPPLPSGVRRLLLLATQSGSSAPVTVKILENTLGGGSPVWGRLATGIYTATIDSVSLPLTGDGAKVAVRVHSQRPAVARIMAGLITASTIIQVSSKDAADAFVEYSDAVYPFILEVLVYP